MSKHWLIVCGLLGFIVGVLSGSFLGCATQSYALAIGILGTLGGTLLGAVIARVFLTLDKKRAYIVNAQNVLLVLKKQLNELVNIENHFNKYIDESNRHMKIKPEIVSKTKWRLSKTEILGLNYADKKSSDTEIFYIMDDLIHTDKSFQDLLYAINDYIIGKANAVDESELKKYSDAIYNRLPKINFFGIAERLIKYLEMNHHGEKFPKPVLIEKAAKELV